ncbi:MAG: hypothetical protein PUH34_05775 [Eubacteriales bacterium]|nr:hypothetical protein [Eubacteriales bacterium]
MAFENDCRWQSHLNSSALPIAPHAIAADGKMRLISGTVLGYQAHCFLENYSIRPLSFSSSSMSVPLRSGAWVMRVAFLQPDLRRNATRCAFVVAAAAGNFKWFFAFPSNLIKNGF